MAFEVCARSEPATLQFPPLNLSPFVSFVDPTPFPLPADARRSLLIYNLFFPFVLLVLLPGFLLRMVRRGGFREKFGQRLARYTAGDRTRFAGRRWVWIHSISVGETFVALKLARALHEREPGVNVLLSTTTSTGFAEARKAACEWLEAIYNPIDARSVIRRALDALRPAQLVLIEGEVWPNLVAECWRSGVPVALADARLSPRSERRFRRFRSFTGPIFRLLGLVCVAEEEDVARWQALGVASARIRKTGSIKFDDPQAAPSRAAEFRSLLTALGVSPQAPILVAGSTWAPEEKILATLLPELCREFPDLLLIVVPRHIERTDAILRDLAPLGLRIRRRSELRATATQHSTLNSQLLLVDATGELRDWYALATVVFIGKSLPGIAETGGQNPAEAAALRKPVVFGPHMGNFAALVAHLLAHEAAIQVRDAHALSAEFSTLLRDAPLRAALGARAFAALALHRHAAARTTELLATTR